MAEYKVELKGHAGERRNRAGLTLEKGVPQTVELTDDQLKGLRADDYVRVTKVSGSDNGGEGGSQESTGPNLMAKKRPQLDKLAKSLGLDPKEYTNKEALVPAIEEAQAKADEAAKAEEEAAANGGEGGSSEEDNSDEDESQEDEEPIDLEAKSVEELETIAAELNLTVEKTDDEAAYKAALVKAIEDAEPEEE